MRITNRVVIFSAFVSALLLFGCSKNDSVESTAGNFLATIKEGNTDKAYEMTSASLRQVSSKDQFKAFSTTLGLTDYKEVRWLGHAVMDSLAYVEGMLTTKDSSKVAIKMHLKQDSGAWKVSGMERTAGFGLAGNISSQFPPDNVVRNLVASWITLLDRAIKSKDFTEFYNNMAQVGKKNTSKEKLADGFKSFVDQNINVGAALNAQAAVVPYLSGDAPNQPRILFVESLFQTEPVGLSITMKFTPEAGTWKLVSMNINIVSMKAS
jgi:hypothetical protein